MAAVAVLPLLVVGAARRGGTAGVVGTTLFASTVVVLYLTSTLYHALPPGRAKRVFRLLDHGAIYLLIAGTYTPFTLGVLRGPWGWTLFGLVWGTALGGIAVKAVVGGRYPKASTGLYLAMGWLVVVAARPLWLALPPWGLFWLVLGGLAYTGGVAFYAAERVRYNHFVWHLFVMAGTASHVVAVQFYAAGAS